MQEILLTGFQPYGGFKENPSGLVASALVGRRSESYKVDSIVLPVSFRNAFEILRQKIQGLRPDVVVGLGLYPSIPSIHVERAAINMKDCAGVPDNDGATPEDEPIIPSAPSAHFSTLPTKQVVVALREAGIPSAISYSAGTHVCNFSMYNTLHFVARNSLRLRASHWRPWSRR